MVDTLASDAVPFTPAGLKKLGINPPPSPATMHRWRQGGLRGYRIETFLRGGRRYTTRAAVRTFFDRITLAADPQRLDFKNPNPPNADAEQAMRELQEEGI